MKPSHILLVIASAAAVSIAFPQEAKALDFNWSFSNTSGTTKGGTVTGTVTGLAEGTNTNFGVTVSSAPAFLGNVTGAYSPSSSSITVSGGQITAFNVFAVYGSSFRLYLQPGLAELDGPNRTYAYNAAGAQFTAATAATAVPFGVPSGTGAAIPLVGTLLAFGAMRKAKKSIASKTHLANPVCASVS